MGQNNSTVRQADNEQYVPPTVPPERIASVEESEVEGRTITKTTYLPPNAEDKLAFTLDGVFTAEECEEWIKMTEEQGYEAALVNIGGGQQQLMTDVRNNSRCIIDSEEMAGRIFKIIQSFLPQTWKECPLSQLNERLRFLRYDPGERFAPHNDGCYVRPDKSELSFITVQLYLNEGFQGGSTTFLSWNEEDRLEVVPKIGRVLVFEHRILHEGSALVKGRKYAVRTDAMYINNNVI